jgi:hypothetical protein
MKKGRPAFFEKKAAKKLLLIRASGDATHAAQIKKSFLVLFFKKELLPSFSLSGALPWRG